MVIKSLELKRVNPDRNIFSINVDCELTSTFFTLQRFGPSPSPNLNDSAALGVIDINWQV